MPRTRQLIAASLGCIVAGSAIWLSVRELPMGQPAMLPPKPDIRLAERPPAPSEADARVAKKEVSHPPPNDLMALPRALPADAGVAVASRSLPAAPHGVQALSMQGTRAVSASGNVAQSDAVAVPAEPVGRDRFLSAPQNGFKVVREAPVSTFSIDVDTASYSFARALLNRNQLPQPASVRVEEMINYFPYDYAAPASASEPFRTTVSVFPSPWSEGRKLMQIGVKGYAVQSATRPHANLVFLVDTSGSMAAANRLPLVKQSLALLVGELQPTDRVAVVTYAGNAGIALEPTAASERAKILGVIDHLQAGGGTAGGEGIREAYALAERSFDASGVNRVMLATDGDFNVGITDQNELTGFIERQREKGIFLSILGFGMGNYNDALMQSLAQNGNGVAAYIDTINEARKVLVEEATSTLIPIAKDVKIQVEFNPATVAEYRLIGYETRLLNRADFNNDKVDAGDVGSGQTVTALYEIVPVGGARVNADLRYGAAPAAPATSPPDAGSEYAFVKLRYKLPTSDTSILMSMPIDRSSEKARFEQASADARFATAVAAFGEILRGGRHTDKFGYDDVIKIASAARGDDPFGYRSEFLQLVRAAKTASAMQPQRQ